MHSKSRGWRYALITSLARDRPSLPPRYRSAILARSYSAMTPCASGEQAGLRVVFDGRGVGEEHGNAAAGRFVEDDDL